MSGESIEKGAGSFSVLTGLSLGSVIIGGELLPLSSSSSAQKGGDISALTSAPLCVCTAQSDLLQCACVLSTG